MCLIFFKLYTITITIVLGEKDVELEMERPEVPKVGICSGHLLQKRALVAAACSKSVLFNAATCSGQPIEFPAGGRQVHNIEEVIHLYYRTW